MRLVAGLCPDPLGELQQHSPRAAFQGCLLLRGREEGKGRKKIGREGRKGKDDLHLTLFLGPAVCSEQILSIQPVSDGAAMSGGGGGRRRRAADQQLDVLLAVRKTDTKYFRSNSLKRRVESVSAVVEQEAGVDIVAVFNSVCTRDSCTGSGVDCVTVVSLDGAASPLTIVSDRESFVSPRHRMTVKCVCRPGTSVAPVWPTLFSSSSSIARVGWRSCWLG